MDELTGRTDVSLPSGPDELAAVRDLLAEPAPTAEAVEAGRARLMAALTGGDVPAGPGTEQSLPEQSLPEPGSAGSGAGGRQSRPRRAGRLPGSGSRFRGRRVAMGALLAGVAAATGLIVATAVAPDGRVVLTPAAGAPTGTSADGTAGATANARQILLAAASAVAGTPDRPGAYWRMKTTYVQRFLSPDRRYLLQRGLSEEMWLARDPARQGWRITRPLGVKPATPQDEAAWRAAGSPGVWRYPRDVEGLGDVGPGDEVRSAPEEPVASRLRGGWIGSAGPLTKKLLTWAELSRIPGGTEELRNYLEARIDQQMKKYDVLDPRQETDSRLRGACVEMLRGLPVSPEVRAAAYRLLATLPGITAMGEVTDALGRTGQGLSYRAGEQDDKVTMVIDPVNGLLLSTETSSTSVKADGGTVTVGTYVAYEDTGWSDEEPDLPVRHD